MSYNSFEKDKKDVAFECSNCGEEFGSYNVATMIYNSKRCPQCLSHNTFRLNPKTPMFKVLQDEELELPEGSGKMNEVTPKEKGTGCLGLLLIGFLLAFF